MIDVSSMRATGYRAFLIGLPLFFFGCLLIGSGFLTALDFSASASLGTDISGRIGYHLGMPFVVFLLGGLAMLPAPCGIYMLVEASRYERESMKIHPRVWVEKTKDDPSQHTGQMYWPNEHYTEYYSEGKKYTVYLDGSYQVEDGNDHI